MEHTLTHETVPLKEEKQYIRDIKQLKQRRDQLSYSLAKQDEVQQSLDQKDHIGKRIQVSCSSTSFFSYHDVRWCGLIHMVLIIHIKQSITIKLQFSRLMINDQDRVLIWRTIDMK